MFFPSFFILLFLVSHRFCAALQGRGVVDLKALDQCGAGTLAREISPRSDQRPAPISLQQNQRSLDGQMRPSLPKTYPTTSMPIDRAVPRMLLIAVSTDAALRSGIFCFAISSTCLAVTLPTLSLFGVPEPLAMPAARFNRIEAGGVLVMKVKERSDR